MLVSYGHFSNTRSQLLGEAKQITSDYSIIRSNPTFYTLKIH